MIARTIYSIATIYMLMILIRWTAPHLDIDLNNKRWKYISKLTDPLIKIMRKILPPLGPMDFGPLTALIAVWLIREIVTGMFQRM